MTTTLPFDKPGRFYRGNLHLHSTRSDGRLTPGAVIGAYRDRGYDFVSLTDHFLPNSHFRERDEGFCTVADTTGFRSGTFTTILGAEVHGPAMENGENWHIVANGLPVDFPPLAPDETGPQIAARAHAAGAFVSIAHPYWNALSVADADAVLPVSHAVEVYNHGCQVEVDRGESWHYTDLLLARGRRLSAIATDDAHFNDPGDAARDAFGGWVLVRAEALDPDALIAALKAGHHYSSTGPALHDVRIAGDRITIECSPVERILVTGKGSRSRRVTGGDVTRAEVDISGFRSGGYLRVTAVAADGTRAWTNPVWFDDSTSEEFP